MGNSKTSAVLSVGSQVDKSSISETQKSFEELFKKIEGRLNTSIKTVKLKVEEAKNFAMSELSDVDLSHIFTVFDEEMSKIDRGEYGNTKKNKTAATKDALRQFSDAIKAQKEIMDSYSSILDVTDFDKIEEKITSLYNTLNKQSYDEGLVDTEKFKELELWVNRLQNLLDGQNITFDDFLINNKELAEKLNNSRQLIEYFESDLKGYSSNFKAWVQGFKNIESQLLDIFPEEVSSSSNSKKAEKSTAKTTSNKKKGTQEEVTGKIILEPVLSETFVEDAKKLVEAQNITGQISLEPQLVNDFKKEADKLVDTETVSGQITLEPKLSGSFKKDLNALVAQKELAGKVTINPTLSSSFKSDLNKKIESKKLEAKVNITPKISSDVKKNIADELNKSLSSSEKVGSKIESTTTNANQLSASLAQGKTDASEVIKEVTEAMRQVKRLSEKLNSLKDFDKLGKVTDFFKSIKIDDNFKTQLETLATDLNNFVEALNKINIDSAASISVVFDSLSGLKLTKAQLENLGKLPDALKQVYDSLNNASFPATNEAAEFLATLREILDKSQELQNLASILSKSTPTKIKDGITDKDAVDNLNLVIEKYKDLTKRTKELSSSTGTKKADLEEYIARERQIADAIYKEVEASDALTASQKERAKIEKEAFDREDNDYIAKSLEETNSIDDAVDDVGELVKTLSDAEEEYKRLMDVLSGKTDWFGNEIEQGENLLKTLGTIVQVVRTIKEDSDGNKFFNYKVTGSTGKTVSYNANKGTSSFNSTLFSLKNANDLIELSASKTKESTENAENLSQKYKKLVENLEEATAALKTFIDVHKDSVYDGNIKIVGKEAEEFKRLEENASNAAKAVKEIQFKGSSLSDRNNLLDSINNYEKNNSRGAKYYQNEIDALKLALNSLGANADTEKLNDAFVKIKTSIHDAGIEGQSFGDILKGQLTSKLASFVSMFLSVQDIIRYVQEAVSVIEDLDYALLDLSKTADMTESQLNDFYYSANSSAQALGVTTEEIINLASGWSRLGYNTNEAATQLAELTAKFAAISPGMTTSEAQEGMTSIMKAWNDRINAENMETEVLDKINVLGKELPKRVATRGALKCA